MSHSADMDPKGASGSASTPGHDDPTRSLFGAAGENGEAASPTPQRIGRYTVAGLIGVGGMGVVYEATQDQPRRTVALKVIRGGLMTPEKLRRFEHESEVLGRLQHPGIAQVYEAGTFVDSQGQQTPFFAMEYIKGSSLSEHARNAGLNVRGRLEILARVCDAVHHAHQKGVIHRDLKPVNILVDESGQPKVLDFGVARVTGSDVQPDSVETAAGQLLGTLPYMSPEQVTGNPDDLDTRSDVYTLGVIAFELLAGVMPHDLSGRSIPDAVRVIRDDSPRRLSSVVRALRGDVETIVGKALEKDKARRYPSAEALASDIRRYLRNEPISARPAGAWYQFRKFALRHKGLVAGLGSAVLMLVAGLAVMSYAFELTRRERDEKKVALGTAVDQADIASEINRFLNDGLLGSIDPDRGNAADLTVKEMVDRAAARLESSPPRPVIESELRQTIGTVYAKLGRPHEALHHLRRALALRERQHGRVSVQVADTLAAMIRPVRAETDDSALGARRAEAIARRELEIRRICQGETDPATLRAGGDVAMYGSLARGSWGAPLDSVMLRMACEVRGKGETPESLRRTIDEAIARMEEQAATGRRGEAVTWAVSELGPLMKIPLFGERVPDAVSGWALNTLAARGMSASAGVLIEAAHTAGRELLGRANERVMRAGLRRAILMRKEGHAALAVALLKSVAEDGLSSRKAAHPAVVDALVALLESTENRADDAARRWAIAQLEEAAASTERTADGLRLEIETALAEAARADGRTGESRERYARALRLAREARKPDPHRAAVIEYWLAVMELRLQNREGASRALRSLISGCAGLDPDRERIVYASLLAGRDGRLTPSETLELLESSAAAISTGEFEVAASVARLGALVAAERYEAVAPMIEAVRRSTEPLRSERAGVWAAELYRIARSLQDGRRLDLESDVLDVSVALYGVSDQPTSVEALVAKYDRALSSSYREEHLDAAVRFEQLVAEVRSALPEDHPRAIQICCDAAVAFMRTDRLDGAESLLRWIIGKAERVPPASDWWITVSRMNLAQCLARSGRASEGVALLDETIAGLGPAPKQPWVRATLRGIRADALASDVSLGPARFAAAAGEIEASIKDLERHPRPDALSQDQTMAQLCGTASTIYEKWAAEGGPSDAVQRAAAWKSRAESLLNRRESRPR
ncbi:MAG: protein kinase [Phycisphaeraceae bacterium]|nr:protein kinase [Phycisphaeraceae bacterium]